MQLLERAQFSDVEETDYLAEVSRFEPVPEVKSSPEQTLYALGVLALPASGVEQPTSNYYF
jgi:hypothetical protein